MVKEPDCVKAQRSKSVREFHPSGQMWPLRCHWQGWEVQSSVQTNPGIHFLPLFQEDPKNEDAVTVQGDPQEKHVGGVQHGAPHERQHVHVARLVGDLLQPVEVCPEGV